jgi:FMN phosphatase YigB (HAD superfamily)
VKAAIFDLDDTLVTREDGELKAVEPVRELVESAYSREDYRSIILTARAEKVRSETEQLLERYDIDFDELYMRPDSDFSLPDERFKELVLEKLEAEGFDISFVVEDKGSVAEMWERNGIECFKLPERHALRHKFVRKLRKAYRFLPGPLQRLYLSYYRRRFS